jgi:hypothetical protein
MGNRAHRLTCFNVDGYERPRKLARVIWKDEELEDTLWGEIHHAEIRITQTK